MKRGRMRELPLHLMILPSVILLICFSYLPMEELLLRSRSLCLPKGCLVTRNGLDLTTLYICSDYQIS